MRGIGTRKMEKILLDYNIIVTHFLKKINQKVPQQPDKELQRHYSWLL